MADKSMDGDRTPETADNAFDRPDGYSGQDYHQDREAEQGRADAAHDTPHDRTEPEGGSPADPDDFSAPDKPQ